MLKQMLSPDVVDGSECYEFTWVGKRASIVEANKPIRKTLRPCPEESKDWDATENLYIEGDNLEVLKLLQEAYLGKVKMIYIDPPYNTGNDFIYADDFMRSQEEENEQMGMYDEEDNRLFKNTDTNGRFHSDWCSMMYSRTMLARNLLSDDGIIFISIDEREYANIRNICDEVFGEKNYFGDLIWEATTQPINAGLARFGLQKKTEPILMYSKCKSKVLGFYLEEIDSALSYPHQGQFGACRFEIIEKSDAGDYSRPSMKFQILGQYPREGKRWQIGEATARQLEKEGKVEIVDGIVKKAVYPEDEQDKRQYKPFWSLLLAEIVGTAQTGKDELNEIMKTPMGFDTVKPTSLIKRLLSYLGDDYTILDFFSGSATTAHAVMQLNAEDGGHRKFIMVQLPEPCDEKSEAYKAGYKNICEIGKERIRRAGAQILERSLESLERDGMIEKIDKSKLPVLSSKNSPVESLEKEGLIEKYAGELSEIRSLEEVYGVGGASVSSHQEAATGGNLRAGRSDAAGSDFDSVEYRGGTVAGNAGVYPVFESGKGITSGTGDTVVALRPLAVLNELGYRVCLERFRGNQQNALLSDQISKLQALNSKLSLDIGFRVLKLDDGNMKDVYYAADDYDQQNLVDMISNIKEDRTDLDLLFGCLLDWGLPLSLPYTSEQIDGCTVHTYNDGDLIACFDVNVPESVVKEIAKRKPLRAVFRDSSFADSPAKINVFEIFKLYMPEDADDISKRVRVI